MAELSYQDLDRLAHELASMTRAGIPMPEGLRQLEASLRAGKLKAVSRELAESTEKGVALSEALARSPVSVPREFISMVRCAEVSGDMRSMLEFAVEHSRRIRRHRSAIVTAMVYPAFVLALMVATFFFLSNSIIPNLGSYLQGAGAERSLPTNLVMGLSVFFRGQQGLLLAGGLILLILGGVFVQPLRDRLVDGMSRLPGFGSLIALSDTAVLTHMVSRMMGRGVPLHLALDAAGLGVWRSASRDMVREMSRASEQGHRVGPLLRGGVPSLAAYLFRGGEERGDLAEVCADIAAYCEDRFDRLSKRALAVLEPALLLVAALFIGLVLSGIYLPLFSIPKVVTGS